MPFNILYFTVSHSLFCCGRKITECNRILKTFNHCKNQLEWTKCYEEMSFVYMVQRLNYQFSKICQNWLIFQECTRFSQTFRVHLDELSIISNFQIEVGWAILLIFQNISALVKKRHWANLSIGKKEALGIFLLWWKGH